MDPAAQQLNVEYFFRLIYECLRGGCYGGIDLTAYLAHIWLWIVAVGYALAVLGLLVIVYVTVRLFDLRKREEEYYGTLIRPPEAEEGGHARWQRINELAASPSVSAWREAVIEADIMLDEVLADRGYVGESLGEKLKAADFRTLQDAWEAHKVRNQVAHEGAAFELSESVARRTIAHYESVFREFRII